MEKIILLPGMDGTGSLFAEYITEISDAFEPIVISFPNDKYLTTSELIGLIDSRCSNYDSFIIIAESFSVPIALHYAASRPLKLKALIICAGFAVSPVQGWKRFLISLLAPIMFRITLPKLAARYWLIGPGAPTSLLLAVRAALASVKPQVLAARLHSVLACEARSELARVDVPILYLQAKQDNLVKTDSLDCIRLYKPQVEVVEIDGPHLMLQREPRRCAEATVKFVRSAIAHTS